MSATETADPIVAATREVAAILQAAVPDGPNDPAHAGQVARVLAGVVIRNLEVREHYSLTVSRVDGRRDPPMRQNSLSEARETADRVALQPGVDEARIYRRYCSRWHPVS